MRPVDTDCPLDGRTLLLQTSLYQKRSYRCMDCGAQYTSLDAEILKKEAVLHLYTLERDRDNIRSDLVQRESHLERIMAHARERGLIK